MSFADLKKKNVVELGALKERGVKIAGLFCTYAPREIIMAAGGVAIGICAYDESPIAEAEKDLPRNLCPLIKASYGYSKSGKCPYMNASDIIIGETTCDGKKKMYELLGKNKPTYVMELPNMTNPKSFELWVSEIRRFKEFIEDKFETKITDEKLLEAINLQNEERKLICEIMKLTSLNPSPISGAELHDTLFSLDFIFDKKEKFFLLQNMIDELKEKAKSPFLLKDNKKRILITGCPSGGFADKVVKEIESLGAIVVGFENCVGTKNFENLVETEGDLIENLAKRYMKIPCSVMYQNRARTDRIKEMIDEFSVDGVVDVTLSACHTYAIETAVVKEAVKDANASYMKIETDYSKQDSGQIKTRLEAFLELL